MKKHAIIPIFIPHRGCQNDCVFCNQKIITARSADVTSEDARQIINEHLTTLLPQNLEVIEVAFFGGSFTGLPMDQQNSFLEVAKEFKDKGLIHKIHMSTRPDYIDERILDNLKRFSVDTIELGVQSFDEEVLSKSKRGHGAEDVFKACDLIKNYGFELGIQLMIGLPGDNKDKCVNSAKITASIKPSLARLYPTLVLDNTELLKMSKDGSYTPLTEEEAIDITKEMYVILEEAGINIMRVGLKSTDLITPEADFGGGYHPAFRQLVEASIARDRIMDQLEPISYGCKIMETTKIDIFANSHSFNAMVGHKASNKTFFSSRFPHLNIAYRVDDSLGDNKYRVVKKGY